MTALVTTRISASSPWRTWREAARGAALVLAAFAAYANSVEAPFVFDDGPAIVRNASIRTLSPLAVPLNPPVTAGGAAGRPLVNLSFALNFAAGELDPRGYRLGNIALHALTALLLWGIVRRSLGVLASESADRPDLDPAAIQLRRSNEAVAFWGVLLWTVHPLLTESVVCAVQRNEIMGGLFYLGTLYAFIRCTRAVSRGRARAWGALAVASCVAGVASKEIVATAPILVLLYDRSFITGTFREAWRRRRSFHLALAGTWLLQIWLILRAQQRGGTVGLGLGISSWEYLLTQTQALVTYVRLSFWPQPLLVDYGMAVITTLREVWWQAALVGAALVGTVWAVVRRPIIGFLAASFFVILAPSSSIVPLASQTIAEHRMYLPLAAVLALFATALHRAVPGRSRALLGALCLAAGVLTWQRNEIYRDEETLWRDLIAVHPHNPRAHVNLAHLYAQRQAWPAALEHATAAVRLHPEYADARNALGQALARTGRPVEAQREFELAHALAPNDPLINFNYGTALAQAGRVDEAIERLQTSLQSDPAQPDVHNNLGLALAQAGRPALALAQFRAGLRYNPDHAALRGNLASALFGAGEFEAAAEAFTRALELQPDLPGAHHNLALALLRLGRATAALPVFEKALANNGASALLHHHYALALGAVGRIAEAIAHDEAALQLDAGLLPARDHLAELRRR